MEMKFGGEKWKVIKFCDNISEKEKYQISTNGNVKSFKVDTKNGLPLRLFTVGGYYRLPLIQKNNKRTAKYIHKIVADAFIPKTDESQEYVLHLDYDKKNNNLWNLRRATKEEKDAHQVRNPAYFKDGIRRTNSKLTETQVRLIKRRINNPKRKTRLKLIAKEFGITEMQLYRIKTGENWGHITE